MPFDPLFHEAPMPAALRAELGIAPEAELFYRRHPTPQWPVYHPRQEGYQTVFVFSLDPDATGALPQTWTPGMEPHRLRLIRMRYGDDRVCVEMRDSPAEGLKLQPWHPFWWEGQLLVPTVAENDRAAIGKLILWDLLPTYGPMPQALEDPSYAQKRYTEVWNAALKVGRRKRADVAQGPIADELAIDERTLRTWFPHGAWKVFKQRVLQALSDPGDPSDR